MKKKDANYVNAKFVERGILRVRTLAKPSAVEAIVLVRCALVPVDVFRRGIEVIPMRFDRQDKAPLKRISSKC